MGKNLLMLSYHFPPSAASGAFRLLGFAEHLPKFGWCPQVIAPPRMPLEPVDDSLLRGLGPCVVLHPVPFPESAPVILKRAFGKAIWLPFALRRSIAAINQRRPDAILTSGPPHIVHMMGWLLKRIYRIPWVADFRDPWVSAEDEQPRGFKERFWFLRLERLVFAGADKVIANAPNAARLYRGVYPEAEGRLAVLTNGFDPRLGEIRIEPVTSFVRLLHAGEIYYGRNPLPLMDAIISLNKERGEFEPRFDLRITGRSEDFRRRFAGELEVRDLSGGVHFENQRPHAEVLDEMDRSHINVLLDSPGRTVGVPAKLYEYLGAGRPILALAEEASDTARVLADSGVLHRVVPLGDLSGIRRALLDLEIEVRRPNGGASASTGLQAFTRESLAKSLGSILDGLRSI